MGMGWPEDSVLEQDLRDYKIIANASGEWGGIDSYNAKERIRRRHETDSYQGGL